MTTICILTTGHRTFDRRVFLKEARSLVDFGYDVKLVAHADEDTVKDGIEIISLGSGQSRLERWGHLKKTYDIASKIDADVYHFHDPELLPVGVALSRFTDGKVIFDAHEDFDQNKIYYREWLPPLAQKALATIYPPVQAAFARRLDAVITTTEAIADGFRRRVYPNVAVVRNFPMTEGISLGDPPVEKDHEYVLMYIGGLTETRGLMRMLRVLRHLREDGFDVGLWLIGSYRTNKKEATKQKAESYIRTHDLSAHVRMLGRIPHEDVFDYLQVGDVGLSLLDEGLCEYCLPTKLIEYMFVGMPVVATDTRTTREYVTDDNGILVGETPAEATEAVKKILSDEDRVVMGENGRKRVLDEYNWEAEKETLRELYSSLT